MSRSSLPRLLLCAALACSGIAAAQNRPPPPPAGAPARSATALPEWDKLTPAQREAVIAVVRERWNSKPGERERMLQHAQRWRQMTPEQRREWLRTHRRRNGTTP